MWRFLHPFCRIRSWRLAALAGLLGAQALAAAPPGGATITNRAEARYLPTGWQLPETVTSNTVAVQVAPVVSLQLDADQTVNRTPGTPLALTHTLRNTGNIRSSYRFTLTPGPQADFALLQPRLLLDRNGDGIAEAGEPALPTDGGQATLALAPGEAVTLLLVANVPTLADRADGAVATTRLRLQAVAQAATGLALAAGAPPSAVAAAVTNTVRVGPLAALWVRKRADAAGRVTPGSRVTYDVVVSNVGTVAAGPTAAVGALPTPVRVDGRAERLFLLRDEIPPGLRYERGSLSTDLPGAWRLFRLPGDAPFSYRRNGDDAAAIEVAVGVPAGSLAPNATASMRLVATVVEGHANDDIALTSLAEAWFDDGTGSALSVSNPVRLTRPAQRVGLALRAGVPQLERDPVSGRPLGTAQVRLHFALHNLGPDVAHALQIEATLAGGDGSFGRYTPADRPGAGEYTLLPDPLVADGPALDPRFDGTPAHAGLLAPGASLPPGGRAEATVLLRVALSSHRMRLLQSARVTAAIGQPVHTRVADASVDGSEPDANGDGDPSNDDSPTPVALALPTLTLAKTAGEPRSVAGDPRRFEVDYTLRVANPGGIVAPFVVVTDALDCAFRTGDAAGPVRAWQLVGPPQATDGRLTIHPGYTGRGGCVPAAADDTDDAGPAAAAMAALRLTDGRRHLAPGESEQIRYTVRFEIDPAAPVAQRVLRNVADVASFDTDPSTPTGAASPRWLAGARAGAVTPLPAHPSGVVYDASTRTPVAGAEVRLRRIACDAVAAAPVSAQELAAPPGVAYRFDADGSVALTTGADGTYAFRLNLAPTADTCEYRLSVTPPDRSGLSWPSRTLPPSDAVAPGGLVQAQPGPPTGDAPTVHHLRLRLGPALPDVWHNHIPLDTAARPGDLLLEKTGNRRTVEVGQSVDYQVRLRNVAGTTVTGLEIVDRLPPGFRYVAGSARLDGEPLDAPAAADGPLVFRAAARVLPDRTDALLHYRAVVGVGTPLGDAVNRAVARSGDRQSNEAAWTVRVDGGVFADEAFLFGKVFLDCNRSGEQDAGEPGVPGVRLLIEDGTGVVTDVEGRYSLYGLRAVTHVLKLDATTLPAGTTVPALQARQSGRGDSRFVDLKKGEWHKASVALDGCAVDGVRAETERRRRQLQARPAAEGDAVARARLALQPAPAPSAEQLRGRAASGVRGPGGEPADAGAPARAPAAVFDPLPTEPPALPSAGAVAQPDLASQLRATDADAGFLDLRDGDTLPSALVHVRVKGPLGSTLRLRVDGDVVSEQRVGTRVRLPEAGVEGWAYVGVTLRPGPNALALEVLDPFGHLRERRHITVLAPGRLARLHVDAPHSAVSDPGSPVNVRLRLTDADGVPVTARTPLTLETTEGRWDSADLNPGEPGTQVFIEGGEASFPLVPPATPRDATLRVSSGVLAVEHRLAFLPELRPLIGAGIVEGVLDLRRRGRMALGQTGRDGFEQTLRRFSRDGSAADASARAAFYFKGTVRGDLLLTAAFDSDKRTRDRLFRDIQPDRYYPIYGDSSDRTFDAQSTQRLYLRVDRQKSYLLYGDFSTGAEPGRPDPRRLSLNPRAATGLQAHHEDETVSATARLSRDTLQQTVIELPADGTSGPYTVRGLGEGVANSEQIEVLVRDRRQPGRVLSTTPLRRFEDYVIEPATGRILFTAPMASLDEDLNTRHVRIRFETETGGPAFWRGGADVQWRGGEALQLGASVQHDDNPADPATLVGLTAVVTPDARTTVVGEMARSHTALAGSGAAARLAWQHEGETVRAQAQLTRTGRSFRNPTTGLGAGRTEASVQASGPVGAQATVRGEAVYSADAATGAHNRSVLVTLAGPLAEGLQGEVGVRATAQEAGTTGVVPDPTAPDAAAGLPPVAAQDNDTLALRGRLTLRPAGWQVLQTYLEAEQDLRHSDARLLAIGGDLQLGERTRAYGRYELISSLGNPSALDAAQQNNVAVIGIENALLGGGRLFNELRLHDALDGRAARMASGARQTWQIAEGLRLGGSLERSSALGDRAGQHATAATARLDYTDGPRLRLFAGVEARLADSGDAYLGTLGLALKLAGDWSLLARSTVSWQDQAGQDGATLMSRQQLGLAWRQVDVDRWNGLGRYEHHLRRTPAGGQAGTEASHLVSLHLNHQPRPDLVLSGRAALLWADERHDGLRHRAGGQLLYGRATWDFAADWDASLQAAWTHDHGGLSQRLFGLEVGTQLSEGLWLSLGWNQRALSDRLLVGDAPLDSDLYLRLRFKFDESILP